MKFRDEYSNSELSGALATAIRNITPRHPINLMEVCGTHTHAIGRFGIRRLLPDNINLLSGPGCPVCVTPNGYIDTLLEMANIPHVIIATFGDLFRVPGSRSSLEREKARGACIRTVYSPMNALKLARNNPDKKVIFPGVGFETTAPCVAVTIKQARDEGIDNFSVLPGFKTLPNALRALAEMPDLHIDGLICPGHLSVITGDGIYAEMAEKHGIACVITGFEPLDILDGIRMLLLQIRSENPLVENEYSRAVKNNGNRRAMDIMGEVFEPADSDWRGIGTIPASGLTIRKEFARFDSSRVLPVKIPPVMEPAGCICGKILTGAKKPTDCLNFAESCTPENPIGACMVSSEGTCAAYYRYHRT